MPSPDATADSAAERPGRPGEEAVVARTLSVLVLLGSGLTAGVLFAVALSVMPALQAMPADRYVYTHKLIGRHWDPTMPAIVLGSTALALVLAFLAPDRTTRVLYAVAAVLLLGVSGVSHLCNVPINRRVKGLDPGAVPADWQDPRRLWRNWNLLRTALAFTALAVLGSATVLA
ncbi:DUF1772 domain-containing protein [Paractinoplanes ferrugineus]|uniref:DUF1772 domain-containing protein n=1 Tax=Paractinoplanes ferrugineus TaxID=113564 RepID=A0A919J4X4_9ACTN|nr:DUF1772 domain-containing protein [Actinoplanes ferrugineus]GIE13709.1 hypothetical protein Afe05nite_55490 [Actinoplanes ferrugineus]